MNTRKVTLVGVLVLMLLGSLASVALAHSEAIEWISNPNSSRYSLSYAGRGYSLSWDKCDWNDYVFKINKKFSASPSKYRIYSYNSSVQGAFTNKAVMGHDLEKAYGAYLCTGTRDTLKAGGASNISRYLFVWVQ